MTGREDCDVCRDYERELAATRPDGLAAFLRVEEQYVRHVKGHRPTVEVDRRAVEVKGLTASIESLKRVHVQFDGPGMQQVERAVIEQGDSTLDERARCPRCGMRCWACVRGGCPRCETMHLQGNP